MKTLTPKKTALLLTGIILFLCIISSISLLLLQRGTAGNYTAYIYLDGELYRTIPLAEVTSEYDFDINSENGGCNTVHVEPGAISIAAADCPDRICVKQGVLRNSLLPITCLPHGLVIELKPAAQAPDIDGPDIITH